MRRGCIQISCLWAGFLVFSTHAFGVTIQDLPSPSTKREAAVFWFYGPDGQLAREEIEHLYTELVLADIHPKFTMIWQQYTSLKLATRKAQVLDEMLGILMVFRKKWQQIQLQNRLALNVPEFKLAVHDDERELVLSARRQGSLYSLVLSLQPYHPRYEIVRKSIAHFIQLAVHSQWPLLSELTFKESMQHPEVETIKWMLYQLGDLEMFTGGNTFDEDLVEGVKAFQARHGLDMDGVVAGRTKQWLELLPLQRARILARNLYRQSSLPMLENHPYILVNIPEFRLRLLESGNEIWNTRVIVGRLSRPTPVMFSHVDNIVFNPPWYVPRRIAWYDLLPKVKKDPKFLQEQGFQVLDKTGKEISMNSKRKIKRAIDEGFPYQLRQKPGDENALGRYKFHAPNNRSIYLHDTPAVSLFDKQQRTFSSGCVRVENPDKLASLLLGRSQQKYLQANQVSEQTTTIDLKDPVAMFLVYWTSWVDDSNRLQFRDDIYGRDRASIELLSKPPDPKLLEMITP